MWRSNPKNAIKRGSSVEHDNITSIFTYMRLCGAQHNRRYVATSVMLSCFTKAPLSQCCHVPMTT